MTKNAMIQELANVGIIICGERRMKAADVRRYYDARFNQPATEKEENTMSTNPIPVTISSAEFIDAMTTMANQYGWELSTPKKEDGVIAREGRKRVLELYWSNTKEKLGGFDLYIRDDLFQDITDLIKENGITAALTVNPRWNMTNRYSFDRQNTAAFLNVLKAI